MERITTWFGGILILFGVVSYVATGSHAPTALVPALLGLPILLLGIAARQDGWRTLALRTAAILSLLGLLGTLGGLTGLLSALILGGKTISPLANLLQAVMALGCAVFVGLYARELFGKNRVARS